MQLKTEFNSFWGRGFGNCWAQGNTAHPHATSKVWDRRNHKQYTYGFDGNGNPTTTHEQYAPPLQGQPNPSGPIDLIQQNYWDEQNQLRGLWNLSGLHHYIYDADGQRLMKSSVPMSYSSVNAQQLQATNSIAAEDYTVYVSAGLVYESNRGSTTYTKHYYAGPLRVASQIGSANPNYETHPLGGQIAPGGPANTTPESYGVAVLSDLNTLLANYGMAVDANEPRTPNLLIRSQEHLFLVFMYFEYTINSWKTGVYGKWNLWRLCKVGSKTSNHNRSQNFLFDKGELGQKKSPTVG